MTSDELVGIKHGMRPQYVVVGAHYDKAQSKPININKKGLRIVATRGLDHARN